MRFPFAVVPAFLMLASAVSAQPYSVIITPRTQAYVPGTPSRYTISAQPGASFSASVYLTAHAPGLAGATINLSADHINPPYTDHPTLDITLPNYRVGGTYSIIVEGRNGPALAADTCTLVVTGTEGGPWRVINMFNSSLPEDDSRAMDIDRNGTVWVATYNGIYSCRDTAWTRHPWYLSTRTDVTSLCVDSTNAVWTVDVSQVRCYTNKQWVNKGLDLNSGEFNPRSMAGGKDGVMWLCDVEGLWRYNGAKWAQFTATNSPLKVGDGRFTSIALDRDNVLWVASARGADRYDGTYWTNFAPRDLGMNASVTSPVCVTFDQHNAVWFAHQAGVARIEGANTTLYPAQSQYSRFPGPQPYGITFGPDSSIWVWHNINAGGGLTRYTPNGAWHYHIGNSGLTGDDIVMVKVTPQNMVWITTRFYGIDVLDANRPADQALAVDRGAAGDRRAELAITATPNPMASAGRLEVTAAHAGTIRIDLYDERGAMVRTVFAGRLDAGSHQLAFDAAGLPKGTYFLRAVAKGDAGADCAATSMVVVDR